MARSELLKPVVLKIVHKVLVKDRECYLAKYDNTLECFDESTILLENVEYLGSYRTAFGASSLEYEHFAEFPSMGFYERLGRIRDPEKSVEDIAIEVRADPEDLEFCRTIARKSADTSSEVAVDVEAVVRRIQSVTPVCNALNEMHKVAVESRYEWLRKLKIPENCSSLRSSDSAV